MTKGFPEKKVGKSNTFVLRANTKAMKGVENMVGWGYNKLHVPETLVVDTVCCLPSISFPLILS